ncbi:homoserine kinase [Microlunatus panaciterrae]|uniref:Homoserine kinase n=1 Tax=Microlunatus panaciterrae TaxID=400768 RepID=A0ABS2RF89_9ACTN|nr:homoserine kinase [Microlunatus panaciterrae]MBM7797408.1 homoserine kinase [Microlunatus panaciterrae]
MPASGYGAPGQLQVGASVTVEVPATSANLGPGFDSFGLALDWQDAVRLEVTERGFSADVAGQGADEVPRDERHLVIASALRAFQVLGVTVPGLHLSCRNSIPHGRGLGSSSAAIVSGLVAALALAGRGLDRGWLLQLADEIEGHPDNVAAAIYGGFVVAYPAEGGIQVAEGTVLDGIEMLVLVPDTPVPTMAARGLLPAQVSHQDASANAGRAALLVQALAGNPELLFAATEDRLHQSYRASAMPESYELLTSLRNKGFAAVISGAGPSVLVFGLPAELHRAAALAPPAFVARQLGVGAGARVVGAWPPG